MLFCAMEEEVRRYFLLQRATELSKSSRKLFEASVLENDEVLFQ